MHDPVFTHDVFFSHSAKDKAVAQPLAERLRRDGLKVWFDEWVPKPEAPLAHRMGKGAGMRAAKIEEGLEHSRVLPLAQRIGEGARRAGEGCMSANAFGAEWAQLEAGTFQFCDPLYNEPNFIPLRSSQHTITG
jgi:hypothetical protein